VSNNLVNAPISSTSTVTVVGTVTGNVTGTITGVVLGTASGIVTAPPAVSAAPAVAIAKGYLQSLDALRSSFKASGTETYSLIDGCYLDQGNSKPFLIDDWNNRADIQARRAFDVGSTRANTPITVLADRTATNADGTTRRELDIQLSVVYTDGTRVQTASTTIISGSSAGSRNADGTACTTSENKAAWRSYGDRRIVDFSMVAINEDLSRGNLSNGLDKTPDTYFNNYIDIRMRDPANVATYYTISGPGLNTAAEPARSIIAVSPRLLRNDPLFAGKIGNNNDWRDTDSFRFCRVSTSNGNFASAQNANCPVSGASSASYGTFNNATDVAADTAFNAFGFVAGGVYDIKVYSGDGWKTVNGFAAATPIATFTHTLNALPYSAAALRPASGTLFPNVNLTITSVVSTNTAVSFAQIIRDKTAFTGNVSWQTTPVFPDGTRAGLGDLTYFVGGTAPGVAAGGWPRSRQNYNYFPAPNSTSFALNQPALNGNIGTPLFGQITFLFTNRNGNGVISGGVFD
jgi:hypothetical protein